MKQKKPIIPLPFVVYFTTVAVLIVGGLADSIYLAWSHYRNYTDLEYQSFCAISKALNCDTVSQSPYSIFFGLPIAVWGIIGYGFLTLFLPFLWSDRRQKKRIWTILFIISICFSFTSIGLAVVSTIYIHSYCIMCVLSFGINFLLVYFSWLIRKRFQVSPLIYQLGQDMNYLWQKKQIYAFLFLPFAICVGLAILYFPKYWEFKMIHNFSDVPVGITNDGHPWIGAEHPILEITEFTDYQCFQCKKMYHYLLPIIMEHPDKIKLIHRHYPLDNKYNFAISKPFHKGSGDLAIIAIYAATKGKFWQMNDLLFNLQVKQGEVNVKELTEMAGLDFKDLSRAFHSKPIMDALRIDLWDGYKLGITGTPAYVIDGKVYKGHIPPDILKRGME